MNNYMMTVTLAVLLPSSGVSGQDEVADRVRRTVEMLELVELAKTDREAAMLVFSGAHQAAARIVEDPSNWQTLPDELDMYFDYSRDIIVGEFGPVPDATRDLIAEAFVLVAIEDAESGRWYNRVAEAGEAGFERVDQALFQIYTTLRERNPTRASIVINGYADRPPERALPYLSRLVAQQDDNVAAMTAIEIMAQAGPQGADAIMALERAGTVNDWVWHAIRWGTHGTNEVCPHAPDFTPCVHNVILGNPVGTMQIGCRDLPRIREAFPPEEYQEMVRRLCKPPMTIGGSVPPVAAPSYPDSKSDAGLRDPHAHCRSPRDQR
ncbi:MAG: hypothetical protein F4Z33_01745 [Gemmatimonadales bacterium]|nr:hypothetical protein [Gemmatimonadales bacterium]MXX77718.1 hypothetical protein [Gemmatimonadales bacterium]MYC89081.1 hypothetical protein [Candidatus Palauibacter denitrificans]